MANITKRTGKDGRVSYRIRVSDGYTAAGKQVFRSTTYTPAPGMTARQIEKEFNRFVVTFEDQVHRGVALDTSTKLDEYIEKWFKEHAEPQLKPYTVYGYRRLVPRISAAMGHLKLSKIRPTHLMAFYDNLAETGMRADGSWLPLPALIEQLPKGGREQFAGRAGVGVRTIHSLCAGNAVSAATADKVAAALQLPREQLFKPRQRSSTLTNETIRHYHRFLSSLFGTAVVWQLITENPCDRVKPPKAEEREVAFLDENGVHELLQALQDAPQVYATMVQLALITGCRRGELCALRWSDLDLNAGVLAVNRNAQHTPGEGLIYAAPKTKKSRRTVRLSADAVELLREYRQWQTEERLRLGSAWTETGLVFTAWNGEPLHPDTVTSWFRRFQIEHGLQPVTFHSLRHTNASLLIAAHVPVTVVSGRLGHAQTSTTTNIYAGFIRSADAAAADALDDVFARIKATKDIG